MNYHITITFFNKLGKIRRNANQSTRITQGQNSPANTDVPHHVAPLEILYESAKMAKRQETPCICPAWAVVYQQCYKPQTDPKSACFNQTLSSFQTYVYGTVCFTIDSSITCLNTPPGGRLALSHSQPCRWGQLQSRRSEMCRWYDREGESRDLAATGGDKQKPITILQATLSGLLAFK